MTANGSTYYVCQATHTIGKQACKGARVNAKKIETFIESFVGALAADEYLRFVNDQPDAKRIVSREIERLRTALEKQEKKLADLPVRLAKEDLPISFIKKTIAELEPDIERLKGQLEYAESELARVSKAEQLDALDKLKKWKSLTIQDKRKALAQVISQMVMHPDRLEITLVARPDSPLIVPYQRYDAARKKPTFADTTDGLLIGEYKDRLVIRIGAEFATVDGRKIRMHVDPIQLIGDDVRRQQDEAEWERIKSDPKEWKDQQDDDQ